MQSKVEVNDKVTESVRYYIGSLEPDNAKLLDSVIRAHWSVENDLHWPLDVQMREDECRIQKDHGPENFATLNRVAVSLLKQDRSVKAGVQTKQLRAATDRQCLLKLLQI